MSIIEQFIDWDKFDAASNMSKRLNGVTAETIEAEVELWQAQIELLEPLDYQAIVSEIKDWDISIPPVHALIFENIAATYARLVAYKLRCSILLAQAKTWRETCDSACKFLEELSPGAFSGTGVVKASHAMNVIQPFVHLRSSCARVENYLEKIHHSIIFAATQLDLLIKEKQSQAKFNSKLAREGEHVIMNENLSNEDENGDVWIPISKRNKPRNSA